MRGGMRAEVEGADQPEDVEGAGGVVGVAPQRLGRQHTWLGSGLGLGLRLGLGLGLGLWLGLANLGAMRYAQMCTACVVRSLLPRTLAPSLSAPRGEWPTRMSTSWLGLGLGLG